MTRTHALPDGVYAASLTPQDADLNVDHAALADHARWLLGNGCDGVALWGTTGEANSFSTAERMAALDAVAAADLPAERLLVGTGCCALPDTVALTRHALAHGAGGVLVLPPFYYKGVREDGLFAAFDRLIQQVGDARLRVYLYHFPAMTAVPFSLALVERLVAAYPEIVVGMKDSSGDLAHMRRVLAEVPGFRLFAGTERYLLDVLRAGGAGCITATTNVTCRLAADVFARWKTGDVHAAQERLTALRQAIETYPAIPALKHLWATRSGRSAWRHLRPPLAPLAPAEAAALDAELGALGFSGHGEFRVD